MPTASATTSRVLLWEGVPASAPLSSPPRPPSAIRSRAFGASIASMSLAHTRWTKQENTCVSFG